ncbi:aminotransferase class I/II-fold pyridoxal phosphate-dependent enzyme [Mycobacterium sp. PS03-16]|nr:aminotransferase class I/II-fold pyridoxal phosphate-dependent enzyme [Mycobacterium sp. PS03-16]
MDLGFPPEVAAALRETIDRQDLGYPYWPDGDPVIAAFEDRMRTRYGWAPRPERTRVFSDLIQILQIVIEDTTGPGDWIALQVPNYPPFLAAIARAGRRPLALPLDESVDGWTFDLAHYRQLFEQYRPALFVLVNPHNPTGRVFTRAELDGLAALALDHRIPVLADEIHAEVMYAPHAHTPFASLGADVEALTITATSATKAFNLAGTRCAVAHIGHDPTAAALDRAPLDYFGTPSALSRVATVAAWRHGGDWQRDVQALLTANRARISEWVASHPDLTAHAPEATYLSWIDFSRTALGDDPTAQILSRGRVQLSPGADFSQHTDVDTTSFARVNFATTPETLEKVLTRISDVLARV